MVAPSHCETWKYQVSEALSQNKSFVKGAVWFKKEDNAKQLSNSTHIVKCTPSDSNELTQLCLDIWMYQVTEALSQNKSFMKGEVWFGKKYSAKSSCQIVP